MKNRQALAFLVSLAFFFSSCATNIEKIKTSNHKISTFIGKPIYIISTSVSKKYYQILLNPDGNLKTDIPSLSHCSQWDVREGRWDYRLEIVCSDGVYGWDFDLSVKYDKKLKNTHLPHIIERFVYTGDFELYHLNLRGSEHFSYGVSRNPEIIRLLEKEELTTNNYNIFFVMGDENLNNYKKAIEVYDSLLLENEQRLVKGYPSEKIIDLRNYQNKLNFLLVHQNEIENPDFFFTLTPKDLELKLSEYEKEIKAHANFKSKKYLIFETDFKKNPYDIKNRGFLLHIEDEYTGGFKRFYSPPIFVSMDIENYEELKYNKVVCIAEYEVITQSETAYLSTKYNGILNKDNFEKYKANFREGLPYIKEQVIKYKQIRLKVLNYRIFNWEEETGDSYWKQ